MKMDNNIGNSFFFFCNRFLVNSTISVIWYFTKKYNLIAQICYFLFKNQVKLNISIIFCTFDKNIFYEKNSIYLYFIVSII